MLILAPMLFKDVIGQENVKQRLLQLVEQNRLSHALLFLGKEGSGALPLALAFANYVSLFSYTKPDTAPDASISLFGEADAEVNIKVPVNENWQQADEWMQKQPAWSKAAGLVHPDIHFSYPVVPRKSGDKPLSSDYSSDWREFIKQYPDGHGYDWLQCIGAEIRQGHISA